VIKIKLLFFAIVLLFATGCSDRQEKKTIPEKQTVTSADINAESSTEVNESNLSETTTVPPTIRLKNLKDETCTIIAEAGHFQLQHHKQPLLLINFFSTWCPPCRGQIPYFEDLQKKYDQSLFIIGILVNDDQNISTLQTFSEKYHIGYFLSKDTNNTLLTDKVIHSLKLDENFTLPLTVLYKNGHYYTHYEGAVPVEMIDHDLKTALEDQ
jgi:thiol-disulfide isomerase/thioredoxin